MPPTTVLAVTIARLARAISRKSQPPRPTYPDVPAAEICLCAPADAGAVIGQLRDQLTDMTIAFARLDRYLRRESAGHRLAVVDGPFIGDAAAAVAAARLWLTRARTATVTLRQAIDNAHLAAGGLACRTQLDAHSEQNPRMSK